MLLQTGVGIIEMIKEKIITEKTHLKIFINIRQIAYSEVDTAGWGAKDFDTPLCVLCKS